jgi:hypothetical protein
LVLCLQITNTKDNKGFKELRTHLNVAYDADWSMFICACYLYKVQQHMLVLSATKLHILIPLKTKLNSMV